MDKIYVNSVIRSTLNNKLIYHVLSIEKNKKKVPKSSYSEFLKKKTVNYIENDDYIIEYNLLFENVNNEKVRVNNFTYKSFLSEFGNKEMKFLTAIIKLKGLIEEKTEVVVEATVV